MYFKMEMRDIICGYMVMHLVVQIKSQTHLGLDLQCVYSLVTLVPLSLPSP